MPSHPGSLARINGQTAKVKLIYRTVRMVRTRIDEDSGPDTPDTINAKRCAFAPSGQPPAQIDTHLRHATSPDPKG